MMMEMEIGKGWHIATSEEIAALLAMDGAPHVLFGCTCCGLVNWSSKNLALSSDGRYTGARNIFVLDWKLGECACDPAALRCVEKDLIHASA